MTAKLKVSEPTKTHPVDDFCTYVLENRGVVLDKPFTTKDLVVSCIGTKNARHNLYMGVAAIAKFAGAPNQTAIILSSNSFGASLSKRLGLAFKMINSQPLVGDEYKLLRAKRREGKPYKYLVCLVSASTVEIPKNQGVLNLEDMKGVTKVEPKSPGSQEGEPLFPHTPAHRSLNDSWPTPCFDNFLKDNVADPKLIRLIWEGIGVSTYGMGSDSGFRKMFLLHGNGLGKSSLMGIWRAVVGWSKTVHIDPATMGFSNSYDLSVMRGAYLNTVNLDNPKMLSRSQSYLKAIISGDEVSGRPINEKPFKFNPRTTHVFACSELPELHKSLERRSWKIPFNNAFKDIKPDPSLVSHILSEEKDNIRRKAMHIAQGITHYTPLVDAVPGTTTVDAPATGDVPRYPWVEPMQEIMEKYASTENKTLRMQVFELKRKVAQLERRLTAVSEVLNG